MVKELMHEPAFLAQVSEQATEADMAIAQDLLDTLMAHKDTCVGMAGNMIGELKRIICFVLPDGKYMTMFNPEIVRSADPYDAMESCLSLLGDPRPARRFRQIRVQYQNEQMQTRAKTFTGFTAQIIQHEIDHCNGVLI